MNFVSTRGKENKRASSAYAIKTGLASDGGLYMPESIPTLTMDEIRELIDEKYEIRAAKILSKFLTDYTYEELLADASAAYSSEKFGNSAAPVTRLGDDYMLELWHGPTSAFKDMALQIMPRLFTRALKKCGGTSAKYISIGEIRKTAEGQETGGGCIIGRTTKTLTAVEWSETEKAFLAKIEEWEA